jgi:hypothetical protein
MFPIPPPLAPSVWLLLLEEAGESEIGWDFDTAIL